MNKSIFIALFAVAALVLWMLSGQFGTSSAVTEPQAESRSAEVVAMKVQTRRQASEEITREVIIQGQVEPIKVVAIKSETTGSVESVSVIKGQRVAQGDVIATMGVDNRNASLTVAKASLVQARNEYAAAEKLAKQGLQSQFNLESAAAKLESARAQVSAAELELDNIVVRAPMDGIIDALPIEAGDFVDRGNHVATLVDNSQLLITGQVPQQNIADIKAGTEAVADLITGETLSGKVHYISSMADSATRSFRVEVLITSAPAEARTGISAEIRIPAEKIRAHLISPAILALDESGTLGIKSVDDNSEVVFHAIDVIKTESNGAWVTGIPDNINIITLGQGFVSAGETVQAIEESDSDSHHTTTPDTPNARQSMQGPDRDS
jgi:multidrug efflux system membrane fusion protein